MTLPEPDPAAGLRPGERVVVRHRMAHPDPRTGATLTDAVGELVGLGETTLTVATRRGEVVVERAMVTATRVIPPRPTRRGAPHRALSAEDLQVAMVDAWPPIEREELGDWLLRAAGGFTNRANSVLTTGDPGMPLDAAVDRAVEWYAVRGLPAALTLVGPVGLDPWADPLGEVVARRGWRAQVPVLTLTAAAGEVAATAGPPAPGEVVVSDTLSPTWLTAYTRYRAADPDLVRRVVTGSPQQRFASVVVDGEIAALGRLGVARAWGGVAAMWVDPVARRQGLARQVLAALAAEADALGVRSLHLQADTGNPAALGLYRAAGFTDHHACVSLGPGADSQDRPGRPGQPGPGASRHGRLP